MFNFQIITYPENNLNYLITKPFISKTDFHRLCRVRAQRYNIFRNYKNCYIFVSKK